jgi:hypothetical protein
MGKDCVRLGREFATPNNQRLVRVRVNLVAAQSSELEAKGLLPSSTPMAIVHSKQTVKAHASR